jgi:hypothetical protein
MEHRVPPPMDWWVSASCPCFTSWHQCWGALGWHNGRQTKGHFPARQWSRFLYLTFLSQSPVQWQSYHSMQIWPSPTALVFLASGLLLGSPPLLSFFPHSSWNSSVPSGMGFTSSTKSLNSSPPRQLSLLPPPSGTNRSHNVDWWDEGSVSQAGPPYSNKTQRSFTVSTPKTILPHAWGMTRPYTYHKFL